MIQSLLRALSRETAYSGLRLGEISGMPGAVVTYRGPWNCLCEQRRVQTGGKAEILVHRADRCKSKIMRASTPMSFAI